ncbi:MAG: hypothetical protein ABFC42_09170 [Sulfuricella sp.]
MNESLAALEPIAAAAVDQFDLFLGASLTRLFECLADAIADIAVSEPRSSLQALGVKIDLDALTVDV